jgi:hypothetical protein
MMYWKSRQEVGTLPTDKFGRRFAEWVHKRFFTKSGKLLGIGCGNGVYMHGFERLGLEGVGCDKEILVKGVKRVNLERDD